MSKFWQYEKATILLTLSAIIVIGVVYHDWVVAVTLPLTLTLGWLYFRLYRLEQWIDHGSKLSEVTDDVGLIGLMVRQIYRQKKIHNKRKKRTKTLLRRLNTNIAALPHCRMRRFCLTNNLKLNGLMKPPATCSS
jgi:hypothetical protein